MRVRKLDAADDMTFGQGQANFHRDSPEAVAQCVETRLRLLQSEWYLDTSAGVPYQTNALGTGTQKSAAPMFREAILDTPGVTEIASFAWAFDGESRTFTLTATINTAYGAAQVSTIL